MHFAKINQKDLIEKIMDKKELSDDVKEGLDCALKKFFS